jgi:glucosamine-6-phosphate deaminase
MSIREIMRAKRLVVSVSDTRKAEAVKHAVEGPVSEHFPASILQRHADCGIFLDPPAAALLSDARARA